MSPPILVFDVESNGLHGEAFAVGAVYLTPNGTVKEVFFARAPLSAPFIPWVKEHVLPALAGTPETHSTARAMRSAFWEWLHDRRSMEKDTLVLVDCGWPVEARFLTACVDDAPHERAFFGPYPLHEVATLRMAAGMPPHGGRAADVLSKREMAAYREHHPVDDALVSAREAREALRRIRRGEAR